MRRFVRGGLGGLAAVMAVMAVISSGTVGAVPVDPAPEARCLCNVYNMTRCEGTGPTLKSYLWLDEERRQQWIDISARYPVGSPSTCAGMTYQPVPPDVAVFNYYGYLVRGCLVVWKNCQVRVR